MNQAAVIQELIAETFPDYQNNSAKQQAIYETESIFSHLKGIHPKKTSVCRLFSISLLSKTKSDYTVDPPVSVDSNGQIYPYWKKQLDHALHQMSERVKTVSLLDFGAIGDGRFDCTQAFKKAISSGKRRVLIPPGVYRTRGLKLPSYTELIGSGTEKTKLVLAETAPKREQLITNRQYLRGNHHIRIEGMALDWNVNRLSEKERTASGGTASSGITLAHVKYAVIRNITITDPGLHGVDVTSAMYNYSGDGQRARLGSRYIWVDQVEVKGFGDDGITTHHSDDILISNCFLHHPSGRAHKTGFSNSNGIEIDDGSQHVVLTNNLTAYCFGGVEIKAHETSSAASDTQLIGHYSYHDNRSYNFRHIGHHQKADTLSQSAFGIRGTYLAAYFPQKTDLYLASTPRALVVSAYQKVAINHFLAKTVLEQKLEKIALSIQYRAGEVYLKNVQLENYETAKKPLRISQETGRVKIG